MVGLKARGRGRRGHPTVQTSLRASFEGVVPRMRTVLLRFPVLPGCFASLCDKSQDGGGVMYSLVSEPTCDVATPGPMAVGKGRELLHVSDSHVFAHARFLPCDDGSRVVTRRKREMARVPEAM